MGEAITEFASLMNGAGRFRGTVASDTPGERKLSEESFHSLPVLALIRIDLGIASVQIDWCEDTGGAMPGTGNIDHVQVVFSNHPIEMRPDEGLAWAGSPMS
jgi:hypothetical protein